MPVIILYLLKLSLSLAVVFSFYHFVLRRLTFYNWNRFYLVAYTALSFFIPFINITPILERNEMMNNPAVQFIPSVNTFNNTENIVAEKASDAFSLSSWDWMILFFATGIFILVVRMLMQLLSFRKIVNNATLISSDSVKLYQVDQSIIPFSFGNSIFINKQQHSEQELEEIIRHEFVHIRQKHTIDIIWSEILCILNWYNPFVWLIRKSIRQNLEFIADDKVLQSGIDKKQYQYLLLKVTGNNHFRIASQFNFSSLKKRIAMMNKMKSAGVHLLKFLFVLPLMAVLILSFRNGKREKKDVSDFYTVAGIVYDWDTEQPLAGVNIADDNNAINVQTDMNGYYSVKLNAKENSGRHFKLNLSKRGYKQFQTGVTVKNSPEQYEISFLGIVNSNSKSPGSDLIDLGLRDEGGKLIIPAYEFLKGKFEKVLERERLTKKVDRLVENSEKPIWVIDGIPFAISGAGSKAWFGKEAVEQSPEFRVLVDGKIMTMDEANKSIKRSMVRSVGSSTMAAAKEQYQVNYNLLTLGLYKDEPPVKNDTIPVKGINPSASEIDFLKRHREIKAIRWVAMESSSNLSQKADGVIAGDIYIIIQSATKKADVYNLSNSDDLKFFKTKYGEAPPEAPGEIPIVDSIETNEAKSNSVSGTSDQYLFKYEKQPLVILDGVEQPENTDPSSLLEPSEIAEMTVWKPGDAVAKYGYKAKSGVIVLTSKAYMNRTVDETVSTTVYSATNAAPVMTTSSNSFTLAEKSVTGKTAEVNSKGFGTLEPLKTQVSSTSTSPVKSATIESVKPVQAATEPKSPVSVTINKTATESVSTVKEIRTEKNIIAVLKSSTTEVEVKKIESDLKSKGYDFKINKVEFKEGKLVLINGTISKNSKTQYFTASDFAKLVIADVPEDDKDNRFNFMVMSGNLNVSDKVQ